MSEQQDKFGFCVRLKRHWDTEEPIGWAVRLPHQCDAWDIAGDAYEGVEHAQAVAALERFLSEGTEALAALRARRHYGEDGGW